MHCTLGCLALAVAGESGVVRSDSVGVLLDATLL